MQYIKDNKKFVIMYLVILIIGIALLVFVKNNHFIYKTDIAKVVSVSEKQIADTFSPLGSKEKNYEQTVKAIIMNGQYKGKEIEFSNERSESGVYDDNINKGDEFFVNLDSEGSYMNVLEFKRDFYVALILIIFVLLIILVGKVKGFLTIVSMIINIAIFILILFLRSKNVSVLLLFSIASILFIVLSLFIVSGVNKKTRAAIISSIVSLIITMLIAFIVLKIYEHDIRFERMDFADILVDYDAVFYSSLLIGGLGAIMDICISMASSIEELIIKNKKISTKALRKSGIEISKDIMGTMINVLLFTCLVGTIPLIILSIRNGLTLGNALAYYQELDLIRCLVGCIGIVIAIPISLNITIWMFKGGKIK